MTATFSRVVAKWHADGLAAEAGATDHQIAAAERRLGVRLPGPIAEYLRRINGMKPNVVDDQLLRFWAAQELELVSQSLHETTPPGCERYIVFADYSLWAHAYAIPPADDDTDGIVLVGGSSPKRVASSFDDFLTRYLDDPDSLLI